MSENWTDILNNLHTPLKRVKKQLKNIDQKPSTTDSNYPRGLSFKLKQFFEKIDRNNFVRYEMNRIRFLSTGTILLDPIASELLLRYSNESQTKKFYKICRNFYILCTIIRTNTNLLRDTYTYNTLIDLCPNRFCRATLLTTISTLRPNFDNEEIDRAFCQVQLTTTTLLNLTQFRTDVENGSKFIKSILGSIYGKKHNSISNL